MSSNTAVEAASTSSPTPTPATSSPIAATVALEAEIARAQALLSQLERQKEEIATSAQKQREQALDQAMKQLSVGSGELIALLKALDQCKALFKVETDAQLVGAINTLAEIKGQLKITANRDMALMLRNRGISSQKAKRLPESTLALMRKVLERGAKVPEVAKYFKVSPATVNARKSQWGLTHRKNARLIPLKEALKGLV